MDDDNEAAGVSSSETVPCILRGGPFGEKLLSMNEVLPEIRLHKPPIVVLSQLTRGAGNYPRVLVYRLVELSSEGFIYEYDEGES